MVSGQIARLESENESLQEKRKEVENELFVAQKELDVIKNEYYANLNDLDAAKNELAAAESSQEQLQLQVEKEEKAKTQMEVQNIQMATKLNRKDEELLKVRWTLFVVTGRRGWGTSLVGCRGRSVKNFSFVPRVHWVFSKWGFLSRKAAILKNYLEDLETTLV